jgi:hypothetical protein
MRERVARGDRGRPPAAARGDARQIEAETRASLAQIRAEVAELTLLAATKVTARCSTPTTSAA